MKKKYVIVRIEYMQFEKYIKTDSKMILDEIDDNSRFDTMSDAEKEIENKLNKYKDKGWEFTILTLYYA